MKLATIKEQFGKFIVIRDKWAVEVTFATLVSNALIPRDPVWTMLVAPSSGGKSTLIAPSAGIKGNHFLDDLTEKTFLSGYKAGKGKEVSLLKIIGNGVMCFSDFTSILAKNPQTKSEILGQLRLIYDGKFSKRTGTGSIDWEGKIGFLGAATPDIYQQLEQSRSMGERFIYYTLEQPTDKEIVKKQEEVSMSAKEISEAMAPLYREYCEDLRAYVNLKGLPELKLTNAQREAVDEAAIFCVRAKATVHLDFKTSKPDSMVNQPGVGRDRKMFNALLHSLQLMHAYEIDDHNAGVTDEMVDIIKKCAYSSVSRERRKVLEILTKYDKPMSATQIGASDGFGLDKSMVEKFLSVLHATGLIEKDTTGGSKGHTWSIKDDFLKDFVSKVSGIAIGSEEPIPDDPYADSEYPEAEKKIDEKW